MAAPDLSCSMWIFTESCDIFMLSCGIFQCDTPLSNRGTPAPEHAGSVVAGYRLSCLPANGILAPQPGIEHTSPTLWASLVAQLVKNLLALQEALFRSLGWGRSTGEGIGYPLQYSWASLVAQMSKNLPAMYETWV